MLTRRDMMMATLAGSTALAAGLSGTALAQAIDMLQIFIPAAPGGGWDQTGRTIEAVLKGNKQVNGTQVTNVAGAGGATVTLSFDSAANALLAKSLAGPITAGVGGGSIAPAMPFAASMTTLSGLMAATSTNDSTFST